MTARLDLLAHAATAATRAAAFPDDEPVEPRAFASVEALRGRLRRYDRVLAAPARAARETAVSLGLDATVEPALRECDYGAWRGLALAEIAARSPDAVAAWLSDPGAAPHGGESVADLIGRVGGWLANEEKRTGTTLAITHAAVLRAAIVRALGAPPTAFWRIDVAPLTLVKLSGREGRWNLMSFAPLADERP